MSAKTVQEGSGNILASLWIVSIKPDGFKQTLNWIWGQDETFSHVTNKQTCHGRQDHTFHDITPDVTTGKLVVTQPSHILQFTMHSWQLVMPTWVDTSLIDMFLILFWQTAQLKFWQDVDTRLPWGYSTQDTHTKSICMSKPLFSYRLVIQTPITGLPDCTFSLADKTWRTQLYVWHLFQLLWTVWLCLNEVRNGLT